MFITLPRISHQARGRTILALWHRNWSTRRHLSRVAPELLQDVGLTPNDVRREAKNPSGDSICRQVAT